MEKPFDDWNDRKKRVNEGDPRVFFHEREVWFCHLGINVGFEQDGKGDVFGRPVIIFRKFNKEVFWAIPLTTRDKEGRFYLPIRLADGLSRQAILSQLRLMDAKRLYQKMGMVDRGTAQQLEDAIIRLCRGR